LLERKSNITQKSSEITEVPQICGAKEPANLDYSKEKAPTGIKHTDIATSLCILRLDSRINNYKQPK